MDGSGFLKSFAIDTWYKAMGVVGGFLLVAGLTIDVRVLTNGEALLIGAGLLVVGLGEWKSRKVTVSRLGNGLLQAPIRLPGFTGWCLIGLGCLLAGLGGWYIVARTLIPMMS